MSETLHILSVWICQSCRNCERAIEPRSQDGGENRTYLKSIRIAVTIQHPEVQKWVSYIPRNAHVQAASFTSNVFRVLRFYDCMLRRWRRPLFQHVGDEYPDECYGANTEREPESRLGRQSCQLSLVIDAEFFPHAPTNQNTIATGLCYEETGVETGDAAVGRSALWRKYFG